MPVEQTLGLFNRAAAVLGPSQRNLEYIIDTVLLQIGAVVDREVKNFRLNTVYFYRILYFGYLLSGDSPAGGDLILLIEFAESSVNELIIYDLIEIHVVYRDIKRQIFLRRHFGGYCCRLLRLAKLAIKFFYLGQEDYMADFFVIAVFFTYDTHQTSGFPVDPCFRDLFHTEPQQLCELAPVRLDLVLSVHQPEEEHLNIVSRSIRQIFTYKKVLYLRSVKENVSSSVD